jgi:hypothetical protein
MTAPDHWHETVPPTLSPLSGTERSCLYLPAPGKLAHLPHVCQTQPDTESTKSAGAICWSVGLPMGELTHLPHGG